MSKAKWSRLVDLLSEATAVTTCKANSMFLVTKV